MAKLRFIHANGSFNTDSYFSSDDGEITLYQPQEISTGAEEFNYPSRRTDRKRPLSFTAMIPADKAAFELFYTDTVDGMCEQFTLRDFSFLTPYTFDSTEWTFDSTEITFDSDHLSVDGEYRFSQPSLEFIETSTYFDVNFELLEAD